MRNKVIVLLLAAYVVAALITWYNDTRPVLRDVNPPCFSDVGKWYVASE